VCIALKTHPSGIYGRAANILRLNKHIDDIKAKDINYKQFFPQGGEIA
jgi:hypothetical protein